MDQPKHEVRIAFLRNQDGWTGGENYFTNLINNLQKYGNTVEIYSYFPYKKVIHDYEKQAIYTKMLDRKYFIGRLNSIVNHFFPSLNIIMFLRLRKNGITLVSHSDCYFRYSKILNIYWIPDLQHIYKPHFFSEQEINQRNQSIARNSKHSIGILLSSSTERDKYIKIYPQYQNKTFVLHFTPQHFRVKEMLCRKDLKLKYKLREFWFAIPNQFWQHKNHETLFEAINLLSAKFKDIDFIFTGATHDYRNPTHFSNLMRKLKTNKYAQNIKILGEISLLDAHSIIFNSLALINPSLYEGWSTSVEEAKIYEKRLILSDIQVHREQAERIGIFFDPYSKSDIANKLENFLERLVPSQEPLAFNEIATEEKKKQMVRNYTYIVNQLLSTGR